MQALLDAGLPVASSCSGDGVCAKCKIQVIEGMRNISPENATESFLRESKGLPGDQRISCQVQVLGDITIDTTYW
ncbi:(2Fe-2S)-binding protein [Bdellovibrio sp. PAP01]|uniref:(2Fe-2S)-binding protein n=2 Tax=Bdellovibrio svalbardensis TaxID=2972972 RepID=A0ABT6DJV0_9BACT|nr:(2Fe-2S)-binding protein [Bdellovibrio svalbardensis]